MSTDNVKTPQEILSLMMDRDYFSQWLGLQFVSISQGNCQLKFKVKKEMLKDHNQKLGRNS